MSALLHHSNKLWSLKMDTLIPMKGWTATTHYSFSMQGFRRCFTTLQKLFSGKLGWYPNCKVHLELERTVSPFRIGKRCQAVLYLSIFCTCGPSKVFQTRAWALVCNWSAPLHWSIWMAISCFYHPKKDSQICWVGDFCALNKVIKCKSLYFALN